MDALGSFVEWFKEKKSSPLYTVFIISYVVWNWKFFFALFFSGNEPSLFGLNTIEYALIYARDLGTLSIFGWVWLDWIINFFLQIICHLGIPFATTYILVWWMPYLYNSAFSRHIYFDYARKIDQDNQRAEYESRKTKKLKEIVDETSKQHKSLISIVENTEKIKEKESKIDVNNKWEIEYSELKKNRNIYSKISQLYKLVYEKQGLVAGTYGTNIEPVVIAYADASGITQYKSGSRNVVELTDKGKFFIMKYIQENNYI